MVIFDTTSIDISALVVFIPIIFLTFIAILCCNIKRENKQDKKED